MTNKLQTGGNIELGQVRSNIEASGDIEMGDLRLRALAGKPTGNIELDDFYGANELECLIKADTAGLATGWYGAGGWGENDRPTFETHQMSGCYDGQPNNRFVFTVSGNKPQDLFRAIYTNGKAYFPFVDCIYQYDAGSNTTAWQWENNHAGFVVGQVYEVSIMMGPPINDETGEPEEPEAPAGTYPVGQGTDFTLTFEDNFTAGSLDLTKWNKNLFYTIDDPVQNFDLSSGKLRIWPHYDGAKWVRREITTYNKFSQNTGFWEAKFKVNKVKGGRVFFSLMNHSTVARPIISGAIFEVGALSGSGWADSSNEANNFGTFVQPNTDGVAIDTDTFVGAGGSARSFVDTEHVFGIKKTSSELTFYLDGVPWQTVTITGTSAMPLDLYIVIGMDYNGGFNEPDMTITQGNTNAATFEYVRAWSIGAGTGGGGGTGGGTNTPSGYTAPVGQTIAKYPTMTFEDNFNGTVLDSTKWNDNPYFLPDNSKNNIKVENGSLYMWPATPFNGTTSTDYNAHIDTDGKFYQKYGYFEIRCRLPKGKGVWPSFWMLNHDLTGIRPEIDIMETYCGAGPQIGSDYSNSSYEPLKSISRAWTEAMSLLAGFSTDTAYGDLNLLDWHTYALHWERTRAEFFIDGQSIGQFTIPTGELDMRMYLNVSLLLGGFSGVANVTDTPTGQSNSMVIDYVRAWSLANGTTVVEGTVTPPTQGGGGGGTPTPKDIVVFVGDSTTWGYKSGTGTQVAMPMPASFAQRQTGYDVRNRGVNSTQTTHWLNGTTPITHGTFTSFLAANTPKFVCVMLGVLDEFDLTTTQFKTNLKTMVANIKSANAFPIILTPFPADFGGLATYAQAARDAASESQCAIIDVFAWGMNIITTQNGGNIRARVPDGVHPDDQFYIQAGEYIANQWQTATGYNTGSNPIVGSVDWYGDSTIAGWDAAKNGTAFEGDPVTTPMPSTFNSTAPVCSGTNYAVNSVLAENALAGTGGVAWASWTTQMNSTSSKYVILQLHSHDTESNMVTRLTSLINTAKAAGKTVVLMTSFPSNHTSSALTTAQIVNATRTAAANNNVLLMDMYQYVTNYMSLNSLSLYDVFTDGTHTIQSYYTLFGQWAKAEFVKLITTGQGSFGDSTGGDDVAAQPAVPVGHPHTYTLTFNEDFNGSDLNFNIWNDHIWYNEAGEKTGKPKNWSVEDGELLIWPDVGYYQRTIDTDGKYYQTYGFFEMEAILNRGRGCWPAFWLLNHDGGGRPEVDIMEAYPGGNSSNPWNGIPQDRGSDDNPARPLDYQVTCHRTLGDIVDDHRSRYIVGPIDFSAAYHKFGCEVDSTGVQFYLDGEPMGAKMMYNFTNRWYILLDLWFGSASGTPNDAETPKGKSNAYRVKYVRAWRRN